jgi:hypothetical protein
LEGGDIEEEGIVGRGEELRHVFAEEGTRGCGDGGMFMVVDLLFCLTIVGERLRDYKCLVYTIRREEDSTSDEQQGGLCWRSALLWVGYREPVADRGGE